MIALRLLPFVLLAGVAQAQGVTSDVPAPRVIHPVGMERADGAVFVAALYRETPPVMYGSADRFVPVMSMQRMPAHHAAVGMGFIDDDDGMTDFDEREEAFADDGDPAGFDDGYFGR